MGAERAVPLRRPEARHRHSLRIDDRPPPPAPPPPSVTYEHRLRVRYAETDQMGVVHHANYVLYFEEARTAYMASLGCPYGQLERRGVGLAVRKLDLRFRTSALYEDELAVDTRVTALRGASVVFAYDIRRPADGARIASGTSDLACIDLAGGRGPRPLPDDLRRILEGEHAGSEA